MAPKSDKKGGSASTGKAAGKYKKLEQLPEQEEEAQHTEANKPECTARGGGRAQVPHVWT